MQSNGPRTLCLGMIFLVERHTVSLLLHRHSHLIPDPHHLAVVAGQIPHVFHVLSLPQLPVRHAVQDVAGVLHRAHAGVAPPQLLTDLRITAVVHLYINHISSLLYFW